MASDRSQDATARRRVGLVVIHGVGEAEPGECLNPLLSELSAFDPAYQMAEGSAYFRLNESDDDATDQVRAPDVPKPSWPVVYRQGHHTSGIEIDAVELYWADTTKLGAGPLDTGIGLFRVIFESQHLFHAMLNRSRDGAAWFTRGILLAAAWMLRGPIAALTIVTSAFLAAFLFEPDFFRTDDLAVQFVIIQVIIFCVAIWLFLKIKKAKDLSWYDLVFWLGAISAILVALSLSGGLEPVLNSVPPLTARPYELLNRSWTPDCTDHRTPECIYVTGLYNIIIWGWRLFGLLLLICLGVLLFVRLKALSTNDKSLYERMSTSIAILMLQFMLWTTIVVSILYPMLLRAEGNAAIRRLVDLPEVSRLQDRFKDTSARQTESRTEKSSAAEKLQDAIKPETLKQEKEAKENADVIELFSLPNVYPDWISRFKFVFVVTTFAVLGLIFGGVRLIRKRRRHAHAGLAGLEGSALQDRLYANARTMPRFLFNQSLVKFLIVMFLILISLVAVQPLIEGNEFFRRFRSFFLPAAATIALIVPKFFGPVITNVVHIARDLIDHHFRPELETASTFLPRYFRFKSRQPRRDRINTRLITLLDHFVKPQQFDDVIFVAHSQGSVIAYDYLLKHEARYLGLGNARLWLLTFGSPLGTIYQTYFDEYQQPYPVPHALAARLQRWINLYRVDDYIGGTVAPPPGLSVVNRILPPGPHMHTNYWAETALAAALDEMIQRRSNALITRDPGSWPRTMPELWVPGSG